MKKRLLILPSFLFLVSYFSFAQSNVEVYPAHWWVGMKNPSVQLMVRGKNISNEIPMLKISAEGTTIANGVILKKIERVENPNYVFLDINISKDAKPGMRTFSFGAPFNRKIAFELKPRRKGNGNQYAQGVTSADLIYLIMPDRFSNGDISNDKFADMNDTSCDRHNPFLRHGGDLQGIINHLDYFKELGATALWLTPVVENDMALTNESGTMRSAYHGYAFTNQYKIDKRFGGNEGYKKMIDAAHAKGLKVIQDAVYNHIGDKHFLYLDPPSKDWFNQWPAYTNTTYRDQPLIDPYASAHDRDIALNGWFTTFMPDLNQRNPFVANYLIQYAIWAVEEFGIDGWRVDTYFYSDRDFLNKVNKALYDEFPHITIFGETTMQSVTEQAFYCQNNINTSWKSNLQGVIDFQWEGAAVAALKENFGWANGVVRLYNILVQDLLYKDPMRNQILLDNHDQDRFYSVIGEDFNKYKMGIALLLTQRGIPQLYYGTEILMKNFKDPTDAEVRKDFPGGWKEDTINKFLASGRTAQENEAFEYVKKLANFRKKSSALQTGKLMQYVPSDSVYTYFRYNDKQTVMCVLNSGSKEKEIDFTSYAERTKLFSKATDITNGKEYAISEKIKVPPQSLLVLELKP
ncbi:MAG: glycoside hydrolase family 13 protein [Bacteroidetes bacterium]|nr:glycoside hydrolase family 13 protein [Bacteroidota bacterium]